MTDVDAAFAAVRREWFLRASEQAEVDRDEPLPIGRGQTNSQPRTVRDMLLLLDVRPGDRVLDVGAGSGWTTALTALLTGPTGEVVGVELEPDLVAFGRANLAHAQRELGPALAPARIEPARPGELGWPEEAPYDRILVSAEPPQLPPALVGQLAPHGVMVIPVGGPMLVVRAHPDAEPTVERHGSYRFVPLR